MMFRRKTLHKKIPDFKGATFVSGIIMWFSVELLLQLRLLNENQIQNIF